MIHPVRDTQELPIDLIVLVAGMHRSGTSAVAGTLHHLGVPAAGNLLLAQPENPRGYYESAAVMEFHDAFLAAVGLDWANPRPIPADSIATAEGEQWVADLVTLITRDLLPTGRVFLVKDPRLSRLLPLWRAALGELGATPRAVIPLRHPRAVAASLSERRGMQEEQGLALWLAHVLEAERDTRDLVRAFTVYDDVLSDWRREFGRVVDQLDVRGRADFAGARDDIDGFLSGALRHHPSVGALADIGADALVDRCWNALQPFLNDPHDPAGMNALDDLCKEYRETGHAALSDGSLKTNAHEDRFTAPDRGPAELGARLLQNSLAGPALGEAESGPETVREATAPASDTTAEPPLPFWRRFWPPTGLRS